MNIAMSIIRIFLLISCLISWSHSADHETFKNCERVEFCKNFRNRAALNVHRVDPNSLNIEPNSITFKLQGSAAAGSNLTVILTGLVGHTFRVKIKDSVKRYELQDVLDGEPKTLNFDGVDRNATALRIRSRGSTVLIRFNPFSIEFGNGDGNDVVLSGDRLSMTSNAVNSPFSFGVGFPKAAQLYGLHEHADNLALQDTRIGGTDPYRLKNSDVANYELKSTMALYSAVPVLYGHSSNGTSGIFLLNAAEQWIDVVNAAPTGAHAHFLVDSGALDLFVLLGSTPEGVLRQYVNLTGRAHLPPVWALGYHQSRYSYDTQADVINVAENFDRIGVPLDALWLDIDYSDGYKYFTWNPQNFSDPLTLQRALDAQRRKLVTIIDPHIKAEVGYKVYDGALQAGLFVKNPNGTTFKGDCWPGLSAYMDFLDPAAREYYGNMYSYKNFVNSTPTIGGIWNDMNEPSVFDTKLEMTLPPDAKHWGNVSHREIHNIYGFLHTMASHSGLLRRDNGTLRPFILSRSQFAGSQRYSSHWTGDNTAEWGYLAIGVAQCLNANILGLVMCGADVGGFFGNPSEELLQRWYQAGAWLPFYRAHSEKATRRREPYLYSKKIQDVIRNAVESRYRHLPVWYTLFYEHTRNGDPIIRPLFYQYPKDSNVYKIDNEYLVGNDILVHPISEPGIKTLAVYFPGGINELWVSANGTDVHNGRGYINVPVTMDNIPVYYRQGSVIVRKDIIRSTTAHMTNDSYTLYVTLDKKNQAHGTVYLDDNSSFDYRDKKEYNYIKIEVSGTSLSLTNIDGFGAFSFTFGKIVYKNITQLPANGDSGFYKDIVFTKDSHGNLLTSTEMDFGKTSSIHIDV